MKTKHFLAKALTESTENILLQVPRALVASVLAAALDFGVLVLLVEAAGWSPIWAAVAGYLSGGVIQYVLCSWWVFPAAPQNVPLGVATFVLLSLVGLGITWATMVVFHENFQLNYALTKVLALGLAFNWNFLSRRFFLFKTTKAGTVKPVVISSSVAVPCPVDLEWLPGGRLLGLDREKNSVPLATSGCPDA